MAIPAKKKITSLSLWSLSSSWDNNSHEDDKDHKENLGINVERSNRFFCEKPW